MNWNTFLTYGDSQQNAFETLCNQLFERFVRRTYRNDLVKFRVINGAGGDGGIEAYGELISGNIVAIQAKWFRDVLQKREIRQIKNSITTAKALRPQIKEYIICVPHDVSSLKYGRGKKEEIKKPIETFEEKTIDTFTTEIKTKYPDLKITWWFEKDIEIELLQTDNEGIHKFWFDRETISLDYLNKQFNLQKKGWLNERYISELHGQGLIHKEYGNICFSYSARQEVVQLTYKASNDLQFCITQIENFIPTNQLIPDLNLALEDVKENLKIFLNKIQNLEKEIIAGNDFYKPKKIVEVKLWDTILKLKSLTPNNIQKNILPKLISSLDNIHKYDLPQYIEHIELCFSQNIRLILGEPGTGKTHGLTNCVEIHLLQNSPAIIIQAKGSPFKDWTEILSKSLELSNWRKDEILSALETLAIKNDVKKATNLKAGEEINSECTKVLVCIDGLEEDIENEKEWYARIRECENFAIDYPRVRFLFSARRYFYNNNEVPKEGKFESVFLPREGDIPIDEIAEKYFSQDHYNIQLTSHLLIKGIDSLFALRLFCEQYKNCSLKESDSIVTAARDLLNLKIEKINQEFIATLQHRKGKTRNPVLEALEIIANHFYTHIEVEHNQLVGLTSPVVQGYLDGSELDSLIDYLSMNAFLIRSERIEEEGVLKKKKHLYNITYQSIIEHIISERIYHDIKTGLINKIPAILHKGMIQPLEMTSKSISNPFEKLPNQKIIQNIVSDLFIKTGQLIGENGFLTEGFNNSEIFEMQMEALRNAPKDLAKNYKSKVDRMFFGGFRKQFRILKILIIPSSRSSESCFGAEYLHQILMTQSSAFERDKLWSGLDNYERRNIDSEDAIHYAYENNVAIFDEFGIGKLSLSEYYLHNETPLIYAWGLSSIDQQLRNSLRVALTDWAIKSPSEFLLLLNKIFSCNDPQIQEDLASIMLGVASRLKDKEKVNNLASWSIKSVFTKSEIHRNVIVRQCFRAIVERAFQFDMISKEEVERCRPKPIKQIQLLPLDASLIKSPKGECYPIVHDLAWYVIKKSYDDFLEYPASDRGKIEDRDTIEAKQLLDAYRSEYGKQNIYANGWAMAAAIEYIKSLGFTRTEGNGSTEASHGSKSKVYTYEEKYTWLAVHHIQGYLADYIPIKRWSGKREFVKDYSQLTDIPNPSESIFDIDKAVDNLNIKKDWVIKEVLSEELETGIEIKDSITNWVNEEPNLNFTNWLTFDSTDFQFREPNRKWLALYNHTSLHDSKELCYSYIDAKACLIQSENLETLKEVLFRNPDELHFVSHLDRLCSSPQTDTYCNPSDIVWMTWIDEDEKEQTFYDNVTDDENKLQHALTKIVQNNIDGETYFMLPSKKVRELIGSYELLGDELKDSNQNTVAFNFKKSNGSYKDNQELVLADRTILQDSIKKEGLEIVWFVELFKQKNPLNEHLDKDLHVQKDRKYFVWIENGNIKSVKFWDERFSNRRDKDEN